LLNMVNRMTAYISQTKPAYITKRNCPVSKATSPARYDCPRETPVTTRRTVESIGKKIQSSNSHHSCPVLLASCYCVLLHSTKDTRCHHGPWNDGIDGPIWHYGNVNGVSLLWSEHSRWSDKVSLLRSFSYLGKGRVEYRKSSKPPGYSPSFVASSKAVLHGQ